MDKGITYLKSSFLPRFLTERTNKSSFLPRFLTKGTTQLNIIEEYENCALYTKNHLQHS